MPGNTFKEATRVQLPALVHLTRLGYKYYNKIPMGATALYDPSTNILKNIFLLITSQNHYIRCNESIYKSKKHNN